MTIIKQVWINKSNNQKCVTIPKGSEIKEGDYVSIEKVNKGEDPDNLKKE